MDPEDLLTPASSIWSTDAIFRKSLGTTNMTIDESEYPDRSRLTPMEMLDDHGEISPRYDSEVSPKRETLETNFHCDSGRKIANARLSDVLRTLFGSNGYTISVNANPSRAGVNAECNDYMTNCKEPRLLELSIRMRGILPLGKFIKVPSAAAYSDDYPRAKIYVACLEDTTNIDLNAQELPVTGVDSGKVSFTKLNFPDNFFDIVVSGYLL